MTTVAPDLHPRLPERARMAGRLRALGLTAVANDYERGKENGAWVIGHIKGYCWDRRSALWHDQATRIIEDLGREN